MVKILPVLMLVLVLSPFTFSDEIGSNPQLEVTAPAADDGETLIDFDNQQDPNAVATMLSGMGVKYSWFSQEEKWVRVTGLSAEGLKEIENRSNVEEAEPNYYFSALFAPNDPYYKYQWHMDQVGMQSAWEYPNGAPVVVAVIDTGVAYEKYGDFFQAEDLAGTGFVSPYDFVDGDAHANDDNGHGTHVAGTIAQTTNNKIGVAGIAPQVKIMPLKVLTASGYGTVSAIAAAIRYAADHGAAVINMSLGGPFYSRILHKACKYAHDKGVVIVCAAGNSGRSGISYPAAFEECISVSAVRYDGKLAWYSSFGKGLTIAAPGGDMNVDQNGDGLKDGVLQNTLNPQDRSKQGYFLFQGTSMATPHVAAAAALLMSHGVTDPEKVREVLQASAKPAGDEKHYGAGILNIDQALKSIYSRRNYRLLALAVVLLFVFLELVNRGVDRTRKLNLSPLAFIGLLFGATGFFFLGRWMPAHTFLLTHPVADWQYEFFGIRNVLNPVFFSVLPVFIFAMLCYAWEKLAPLSVGFAIGFSSFLLYQSFSPLAEIHWIPGSLLESLWMLGNAALCCLVAITAAFRSR